MLVITNFPTKFDDCRPMHSTTIDFKKKKKLYGGLSTYKLSTPTPTPRILH